MIVSFCGCSSSSDDEVTHYYNFYGSGNNDPFIYELISGVSSSDIKLLYYNKVYTNSDYSDSMLVFIGVKNNKLWVEGYHADNKDWLSTPIAINKGGLPWNVSQSFSWEDSEDIGREIRYRVRGEIVTDTLQTIRPLGVFGSGENMALHYIKEYDTNNDFVKCYLQGVKFFNSKKTLESKIISDRILSEYEIIISPYIKNCLSWTDNYIITSFSEDNTPYNYKEKNDCYSLDGQYQFSCAFSPYGYIGISREYGISKQWPEKVNIVDGTTVWSITEEQVIQKLGLTLGEKDNVVISYDSKESGTVYVYNVKIQWEDLYKGDEIYKIKVNIDTGELL